MSDFNQTSEGQKLSQEVSVEIGGLTRPRSLSPTSAGVWQQCELKYALTYLAGWHEPSTLPQLIGNVVHGSVELLYGIEPEARTRPAASESLRAALEQERSKPTYDVLLAQQTDAEERVLTSGEESLDGLFALEDPTHITVGPEGLEVWVRADLYGAPVRGRIDRLYDARGAEVVADYKTGKVPRPAHTKKAFFGLWTYAAGLAAADPDHRLADRIELLYLTGRVRMSRPVLRQVALDHARELAGIWRAILQGVDSQSYAARRSRLCDWCAFQPACPAFHDVPTPGSPKHDALLAVNGLQRSRQAVVEAVERVVDPNDTEGVPS